MARRARNSAVAEAATVLVAGIYLRISQDREGKRYGVDRQKDMTHAVAAKLGATVYEVYCDNDIGASTQSVDKPRPNYDRMLADAKAGRLNVIISLSTSRLTRRPRENEDLLDLAWNHGVAFHYAKSPTYDLNTADGREAARLAAVRDTAETERMAERVADARRQKAMDPEQCGFGGGPRPFGYGVVVGYDPRVKADIIDYGMVREDEAAEVRNAADQILTKVPLRSIVRDLDKRGVLTVGGGKWGRNGASTLRGIMLRPRNAGFLIYNGEVVGRKPELAILDEEVWRAVVAKLTNPARCTNATGRAPRWLGSGLYLCWCGQTVGVHVQTKRGKPPLYRCSGEVAGHIRVDLAGTDDAVIKAVVRRMAHIDNIDLIVKPEPGVNTAALRAEKLAKAEILDQYVQDEIDGLRTRQQVITATRIVTARLVEIDRLLDATTAQSPLARLVGVKDVRAAWDTLALGVQRQIINELFVVQVDRDRRLEITAR